MAHLVAFTYWARGAGTVETSTPSISISGPSVGIAVDQAASKRTIYLGWRSCVPIGH
jgi:hypothetical protein